MKAIKLLFTSGIQSPLFETEKGCSLLELKKAEIDTTKKVKRVAYLVTATKARN